MLNLNCIICAELFSHSDDVHVTVCGHMFHFVCLSQWLERSKTCPQCRNKCNERNIIRLYFNLANLDTSRIDVGSLQEQVDNLKLQVQIKERELRKAEDQIKTLKESQKKCMKTITGLEDKLKKNDFILLSYVEQIKILKIDAKVTDDLRKEVKSLKQQLEAVEGVSCILAASNAEAERLLKSEKDPKKLSVWVTTLKRELRNCDSKKTDIQNVLRVVQSDLRREVDNKKKLEERISQLESECYQLTEKVKTLEDSTLGTSRIRHNSPKNEEANMKFSALNLIKTEEKRHTLSPTIKESIRKIEESDSPYLNIKSSSVGLMPFTFKRDPTGLANKAISTAHTTTKLAMLKVSPNKSANSGASLIRKTSSEPTEKYSIFKKPRLGLSNTNSVSGGALKIPTLKPLPSNLVFNGFGGSEKIDPFERDIFDDDEIEIIKDNSTNRVTKTLKDLKTSAITPTSGGAPLKKSKSATGSSLSERLKSGGLRNFMSSGDIKSRNSSSHLKTKQSNDKTEFL